MTAALEVGEWSAARPGRTLPRERPGTHFTGGWVGNYYNIVIKGTVIPLEARCGIEDG